MPASCINKNEKTLYILLEMKCLDNTHGKNLFKNQYIVKYTAGKLTNNYNVVSSKTSQIYENDWANWGKNAKTSPCQFRHTAP